MKDLLDFALQKKLQEVQKRKNTLQQMHDIIDWQEIANTLPDRTPEKAGRRPIPHTTMIKTMLLQAWHSLSDEETEYQCHNRFDFQAFLDCASIPDARTIWAYREWLSENNCEDILWTTVNTQLRNKNISVSVGKIQDATFVHAPPGKTQSGMQNRGHAAKTSRSKNGSWTKKGHKSVFGFKTHFKTDHESKLVDEIATSTASTHDNRIDLADPEDVIFRDRGYSGSYTQANVDMTMKKGNLSSEQKKRNKYISKIRCRGEHPLATIVNVFKGGKTRVTTNTRVFVQQIFVYLGYNIHRARFLLSS